MDTRLIDDEQVTLDTVIVNKAYLKINHIDALNTVKEKTVYMELQQYYTSHSSFWNSYYGLDATPDDLGFDVVSSDSHGILMSKDVDCSQLQK